MRNLQNHELKGLGFTGLKCYNDKRTLGPRVDEQYLPLTVRKDNPLIQELQYNPPNLHFPGFKELIRTIWSLMRPNRVLIFWGRTSNS